jgi:hypothetical protein
MSYIHIIEKGNKEIKSTGIAVDENDSIVSFLLYKYEGYM